MTHRTPLPVQTPESLRVFGKAAVASRKKRADFLASVAAGTRTPGTLLRIAQGDDTLNRILARDFIRSVPSLGPATAALILDDIGISPTRRIRGLGIRQVTELTVELDRRARLARAASRRRA